ncbi:MAG: hypothetical protein H7336_00975 [Bacteriovorax sp.]|nr:hypothetical protein [Bacteriovorax sp.]
MKKLILALFIVSGLIGVWWISSRSAPSKISEEKSGRVATPEQILANDYEKIAKNLKPENISGDEWKQINTYSLAPEKIVTKVSAPVYFKTAQNNIPDIFSCLKRDFCGMTTRNDNDSYFDDQKTPAHILINRNLQVMKESLKQDPLLKSQVDWELMQELAASGSEMLAVEALDIIRQYDAEGMKTDELLKLSDNYRGEAQAEAIERISKKNSPSDKLLVSNKIQDIFESSDNDTVISVLDKVKGMNYTNTELSHILINLCRYKNDVNEVRNWRMIKSKANKIFSDFEKLCN